MKIEMQVGTRATAADFRNTYKARYLLQHGWRIDSVARPVEGDIIIRATFSEVVHPEPQPGYWITDDMEGAQFVSENHGGCIWWEDRQQLFDGLTEIGVKIYEK